VSGDELTVEPLEPEEVLEVLGFWLRHSGPDGFRAEGRVGEQVVLFDDVSLDGVLAKVREYVAARGRMSVSTGPLGLMSPAGLPVEAEPDEGLDGPVAA
jgi:hypothetical protein